MEEDKADKIKKLADLLISTLGNMEAKDADRLVKAVASALYNDILEVEGEIVERTDGFIDYGDMETGEFEGARLISHRFVPKGKS